MGHPIDAAGAYLRILLELLAELMLVEVVGVGFAEAHAEASGRQHVLTDAAERRIYELLGRPARSPYGNPVHGLDALGVAPPDPGAGRPAAPPCG
ncbi:iron dependent repressor, metal binding and dimerization domain protein [Phytohabitans maris]|uniref:iron dependent repressor, metal binding and dimerization domain protein n=1 Tax=Phytohabitans maris TaxID=3071409 RepID=UPI003D183AE3